MKQVLNVIVYSSSLHDNNSVFESREPLFNILSDFFDISLIKADQLDKESYNGATIIFIATGGTEELFVKTFNYLPSPIFILSDSFHNSLAASLEISTWLYNNKIKHIHYNASLNLGFATKEHLRFILQNTANNQKVMNSLKGLNIALFGDESPWLISSHVDTEYLSKKFGVVFKPFKISDVTSRFLSYNASSVDYNTNFKIFQPLLKKRDDSDLLDALKISYILESICQENNINALTIKCFDMLSSCKTTACLALSLFNDKGIIAGCEGDIPSLWTMIISHMLLNKTVFMANPSSIDADNQTIDFAHCTIPTSIVESYSLPSHFESQIGIGIEAKLNKSEYTIFKISGTKLDRYFVCEGSIVENTEIQQRCRTQVRFKFQSKEIIDQFLNSHIGNHVIIIPGLHKNIIDQFMNLI